MLLIIKLVIFVFTMIYRLFVLSVVLFNTMIINIIMSFITIIGTSRFIAAANHIQDNIQSWLAAGDEDMVAAELTYLSETVSLIKWETLIMLIIAIIVLVCICIIEKNPACSIISLISSAAAFILHFWLSPYNAKNMGDVGMAEIVQTGNVSGLLFAYIILALCAINGIISIIGAIKVFSDN